jgi:ribosomal protein L32
MAVEWRQCKGCGEEKWSHRKCKRCAQGLASALGADDADDSGEEDHFAARARRVIGSIAARAKKEKIHFSLSANDLATLFQSTPRCPCCDWEFDYSSVDERARAPSVDRLFPSLGYVTENVSILCLACNSRKGNATAAGLRRIADWMDERAEELGHT